MYPTIETSGGYLDFFLILLLLLRIHGESGLLQTYICSNSLCC
jgi:hypothetical protein